MQNKCILKFQKIIAWLIILGLLGGNVSYAATITPENGEINTIQTNRAVEIAPDTYAVPVPGKGAVRVTTEPGTMTIKSIDSI